MLLNFLVMNTVAKCNLFRGVKSFLSLFWRKNCYFEGGGCQGMYMHVNLFLAFHWKVCKLKIYFLTCFYLLTWSVAGVNNFLDTRGCYGLKTILSLFIFFLKMHAQPDMNKPGNQSCFGFLNPLLTLHSRTPMMPNFQLWWACNGFPDCLASAQGACISTRLNWIAPSFSFPFLFSSSPPDLCLMFDAAEVAFTLSPKSKEPPDSLIYLLITKLQA